MTQTYRVQCKCGWRREVESTEAETRPLIHYLTVQAIDHEAQTIRQSHKHETTEVTHG